MNEGNSPNAEECSETLDDAGLCAAYAEIHRLRGPLPMLLGHPADADWCAAVESHHTATEEIVKYLRVELETAKNDRNKAALQERQKYLPKLAELKRLGTELQLFLIHDKQCDCYSSLQRDGCSCGLILAADAWELATHNKYKTNE